MKVAVMTGLFAKRDMDVDAAHISFSLSHSLQLRLEVTKIGLNNSKSTTQKYTNEHKITQSLLLN